MAKKTVTFDFETTDNDSDLLAKVSDIVRDRFVGTAVRVARVTEEEPDQKTPGECMCDHDTLTPCRIHTLDRTVITVADDLSPSLIPVRIAAVSNWLAASRGGKVQRCARMDRPLPGVLCLPGRPALTRHSGTGGKWPSRDGRLRGVRGLPFHRRGG